MIMDDNECEQFLSDMRILLVSLFIERSRECIGYAVTSSGQVLYDDIMSKITALDYVLSKHFEEYERIASDKNIDDLKDSILQSEITDYLGGYRIGGTYANIKNMQRMP